ncbi:ABC transporter transmembrane domain-containing protein [Alphaproteobacteria bacterium]|nr:ABC transporter transmembrane domain-containing protein [Alphaproteobacteria bacterium]
MVQQTEQNIGQMPSEGDIDAKNTTGQTGVIASMRVFWPWIAPHKKQIILALLSILLVAVALLSLGRGIALLVDSGFGQGEETLLRRAIMICVGITALLAVGSYMRTVLINRVAERVISDIRKAMYRHMIGLSTSWFENRRRGDLISTFSTDTTMIQSILASSMSMAARNMLLLVGGLIMVVLTSPKLTLVILGVVPLVVVPLVVIGRMLRRQSRIAQDRIADLSVEIEESLSSIDDILAFGQGDTMVKRFEQVAENSYNASRKRILLRGIMSGMVIFLVFAAITFILWLGGLDLLKGEISAGDLSAFVFYAALVATSVGALSDIGGEWQRLGGAAERIAELLSQNDYLPEPQTPMAFPEQLSADQRDQFITFDQVSFSYPTRPQQSSLDQFSVTIKQGESIAIVGESGAGKSTIFKMLLRLYDPAMGTISIGGIDLKDIKTDDLRGHIAVVPQNASLFSSTVYDNIAFGKPDASPAAVEQAAQEANAHRFITDLPQGYNTLIGEKGVQLSGGQRQRLAIARALLRDAPILLLDEATSALDSSSEQKVQSALMHLMQNRTTIVIAHRLSTVINADRILVMDNGQLIASGDHDTLLATSPVYHKLASLQFMTGLNH